MSAPGICRYWASTGSCVYGDACAFSHSIPTAMVSHSTSPTPLQQQQQQQQPPPQSSGRGGKLCRNILLYGYCRYAGRGCEFNHDVINPQQQQTTTTNHQVPSHSHLPHSTAIPSSTTTTTTRTTPTISTTQTTIPANSSSSSQQQPHFGRKVLQTLFVEDTLRGDLLFRESILNYKPPQEDLHVKGLPSTVHKYHSLIRLDEPTQQQQRNPSSLGFPTQVYRSMGSLDGQVYVLRQVENIRTVIDNGKRMAELWQRIRHPSVVSLRDVFISSEINETPSLFAVYDYFPGSETLESIIISNQTQTKSFLSEEIVWSAACQLISAISTLHSKGLTCRGTLAPSKILVITSENRYRINCCGITDIILGNDQSRGIELLQQDDLTSLGRLLLALALQSLSAWIPQGTSNAIELLSRNFSTELVGFITFLIGSTTTGQQIQHRPTIEEASALVVPHLLDEASRLLNWTNSLEDELTKEIQNGRILRLLAKLNFVATRFELANHPSWTQDSGEYYLLRVFRDQIFSCIQQNNNNVIYDLGNVIDSLNKLDAGSNERLVLLSHDDQTAFVITYSDIKHLLEDAFQSAPIQQQSTPQQQHTT